MPFNTLNEYDYCNIHHQTQRLSMCIFIHLNLKIKIVILVNNTSKKTQKRNEKKNYVFILFVVEIILIQPQLI